MLNITVPNKSTTPFSSLHAYLLGKPSLMGRKISSDQGGSEYLDRLTAGLLRQKPPSSSAANKRYILILKFSVLFGLMVVAVVIGYVAYAVVKSSETKQFTQAYNTLIKEIVPSTNIGTFFNFQLVVLVCHPS